jgi:hypothetical protein
LIRVRVSNTSLHRSPGRLRICLSLICNPVAAMVAFFTLFAGPVLYTAEVRARFDLVGFDPRGTNRSTALR